MGKWQKVARCKCCGKIYPNGVDEICNECGAVIAKKNAMSDILGLPCMMPTENLEFVVARRKWFKWIERKM